jgi:hypothetical protein
MWNVSGIVFFQTSLQIFRKAGVEMLCGKFALKNVDIEEFHLACRAVARGAVSYSPAYAALRRGSLRSTQCSERRLVRGAGFEPARNADKHCVKPTSTHQETHQDSDLVKITAVWSKLSPQLKAAILAIVGSVTPSPEVEP